MFDRLFNILRSELGDLLHQKQNQVSDEDWELYQQHRASTQQQSNYQSHSNPSGNFSGHAAPNQEEVAYYAALELRVGASFEEIKASYKRLIKQYHPDKYHNDRDKYQTALEITQKLNRAYSYFEKKFGK